MRKKGDGFLEEVLRTADTLLRSRESEERADRATYEQSRSRLLDLLERPAGVLLRLKKEHKLSTEELTLVVIMVAYRLSRQAEVSGREILGYLYDSSYEVLQAVSLLDCASGLLSRGLVVCTDSVASQDPLDSEFTVSDTVLRSLVDTVASRQVSEPPIRPYESTDEYLLDLRQLFSLCSSLQNLEGKAAIGLRRRVRRFEKRMLERLALTRDLSAFPLLRLKSQYALTHREHLVVSVLYLFHRYAGRGASLTEVSPILAATGPSDAHRFFEEGSTLLEKGLVKLSRTEDGFPADTQDEPPNEVSLTAKVLHELSEPASQRPSITSDEMIEFHNFLKRMRDTGELFGQG